MRELPEEKSDIKAWAQQERAAENKAKRERREREIERIEYEEAERQRKLEEREAAEQLRLEAERLSYYSKLETIDFSILSLENYPNDNALRTAKKSRTLWYIILGLALFLFLLSLFQLTHAWVGGIAGGLAFVVWLTHGLRLVNFFPSLTNYNQLLRKRRTLKRELVEYIQQLEGAKGFMHRLYPLAEYNQRLAAKRFRRLISASTQCQLASHMRTLEDTMEYRRFMQEALKAYREMQLVVEENKRRAADNQQEQNAEEQGASEQDADNKATDKDAAKKADEKPEVAKTAAEKKESAAEASSATLKAALEEREAAKKEKGKAGVKGSTHQLETTSTFYSKEAEKETKATDTANKTDNKTK